jgi:hypothetical protein
MYIFNDDDDDDVYLKKMTMWATNTTQKCRPAKGISKRVNLQILKEKDMCNI